MGIATHRASAGFGLLLGVAVVGCGAAAPPSPASDPPPRVTLALRFEPAPDDRGVPMTQVLMVAIELGRPSRVVAVGRAAGACHHIRPEATSLLAVECAWGPAQTRVWLERQGDRVVAVLWTAGDPRPVEAAALPIPARATIEPLQPETLPIH